jgi:hypothetical protein
MASELEKFCAIVITSDDNDVPAHHKTLLPPNLPMNGRESGGWVFVTAPKQGLHPAREVLLGYNDHRIVMSLAVLATVTGKATIDHADAVKKSFPEFYECLTELGLDVDAFGWNFNC